MPYLLIAKPWDEDAAAERPLHLSDTGYVTSPADAIPDLCFVRRIEAPLTLTRSLWSGTDVGGYSSSAAGSIKLANDDGALDGLDRLCWDGRPLELWHVAEGAPFAAARLLFSGVAERAVVGDEVEIEVSDPQALLDKPFGLTKFAGTGGAEGGAELEGRYRPLALGRCPKIEPVLIDEARQIYQINDGPIRAVLGAWDLADPFDVSGGDVPAADLASGYAALAAADMTGVDYKTCLPAGLIRLTAKPEGRLLLDVEGMVADGRWLSNFADLAVWSILRMTTLTAADIAAGAEAAIRFLCPQVLNIYADGSGSDTVRAFLDTIAESVGAHFGFDERRQLDFGVFCLPDEEPDFVLTDRDVLSIAPRAVERRLWKQEIGWGRAWATLGKDDFAGAVPEDQRAAFLKEWRVVAAEDPAVKAAALLAEEERVDTALAVEADAAAEAARRLSLWKRRLRAFDVVVAMDVAGRDLTRCRAGVTVRLFDRRFRLSGGADFRVLESRHDHEAGELHLAVMGLANG